MASVFLQVEAHSATNDTLMDGPERCRRSAVLGLPLVTILDICLKLPGVLKHPEIGTKKS